MVSDYEKDIPKDVQPYRPYSKKHGGGGHRSFRLTAEIGAKESGSKRKMSVVLFVIAAALTSVALVRQFVFVVGESDRAMVETVSGQVRRALVADFSKRLMTGDVASIAHIEHANPFELYGKFAENYAGRMGRGQKPPPGTWYFDERLNDLVYRVRDVKSFKSGGPFRDEVRFHINVFYEDLDGDGVRDYESELPTGVELTSRYRYGWIE